MDAPDDRIGDHDDDIGDHGLDLAQLGEQLLALGTRHRGHQGGGGRLLQVGCSGFRLSFVLTITINLVGTGFVRNLPEEPPG